MKWFCLVLAGILFSFYAIAEGAIWPRRPAAGAAVVFSDTFELTPEVAACDATGSTEVATNVAGASTTCDHGESLDGSEACYLAACVDNAEVWANFDSTFSAGIGSGTMVVKYLMQVDVAGSDAVTRSHMRFNAAGDNEGPRINYRPSDGRFEVYTDELDDSDWTTNATVVGTTYKMCLEYQFTGDIATLYIDAAGGTYCTTQEAQADAAGDYGGADIDGLVLNAANDGDDSDCADFIYDNIEVSYE